MPSWPGGIIGVVVGLALALATAAQTQLEPTQETHTGPWYQPGAPELKSLWQPDDPGRPLNLSATVLSTSGEPIAGALVELWHTNSAGDYPPLRASRRTGENGRFAITTVLPGHNQGYRARHVHFVFSHPKHETLVTRIYFKGDPNIDEAPWPQFAIFLEESTFEGRDVLFGNVQFVLRPR